MLDPEDSITCYEPAIHIPALSRPRMGPHVETHGRLAKSLGPLPLLAGIHAADLTGVRHCQRWYCRLSPTAAAWTGIRLRVQPSSTFSAPKPAFGPR